MMNHADAVRGGGTLLAVALVMNERGLPLGSTFGAFCTMWALCITGPMAQSAAGGTVSNLLELFWRKPCLLRWVGGGELPSKRHSRELASRHGEDVRDLRKVGLLAVSICFSGICRLIMAFMAFFFLLGLLVNHLEKLIIVLRWCLSRVRDKGLSPRNPLSASFGSL